LALLMFSASVLHTHSFVAVSALPTAAASKLRMTIGEADSFITIWGVSTGMEKMNVLRLALSAVVHCVQV
jgi:hypothetical protein